MPALAAPGVARVGSGGRAEHAAPGATRKRSRRPGREEPCGVGPLQPKLRVNDPNDQYEREADRIAERVMSMPEPRRQRAGDKQEEESPQAFPLQRQEEEQEESVQTVALQRQEQEEEEEEAVQTLPLQRQEDEKEESVQTLALQRQEEPEEELAPAASLQRQAEEEEEEALQQRPSRRYRPHLTPQFETVLRRLRRHGGQPLPVPLRAFLEPRFGRRLDDVRVHTGAAAAGLAREANARAFTVGRHVVFGAGEYRPGVEQGRRLIAHELTHVMQQRGGLHSVQREVALAEPARPEWSGAAALEELRRLFDIRRSVVSPMILRIVDELLQTTLHSDASVSVMALLGHHVESASVTRTIEAGGYTLTLHVTRGSGAGVARWVLTRSETGETFFAHARELPGEDVAGRALRDEARLTVGTPLPPAFERPGAPREAPSPGVERALQIGPGGTPTGRSAPPPATPIESDALAAADAAPDIDQAPVEREGGGEHAGKDVPALARPPVDEDPDAEQVPEEPPADRMEVRRKAVPSAGPPEGTPAVGAEVAAVTRGGGRPVPGSLRRFMELRLGADLAAVRVHDDARSSVLARALRATAFTRGEHIVFAAGEYRPQTAAGRRLIAHEISHVLQQRHQPHTRWTNLLQRQADDCPPPDPIPEIEVVPSPASPKEDPAFQKAEGRVDNRAEHQSRHAPGEDKSAAANAAAEVKDEEKKSHAQKDQVGTMDAEAQNPPVFDKQAFVDKVLEQVERIAPGTLDDVLKFQSRGKAGEVKSAVTGQVARSQEASTGPLENAATADPGPGESPRTPAPLAVEGPGVEPASVRADRAMPPPKTESEIDMSPDTVRTGNILKEACITREFMERHDDPELKEGIAAQDSLEAASETRPQEFREREAGALESARAGASAAGAQGVEKMFGERAGRFGEVGQGQQQTKTDNEVKRAAAARAIDGVFTSTQTKVQKRLEKLETDVAVTFDREAGRATDKFEKFVREKAKEYEKSWFDTAVDWFSSILFDPPPQEVRDFYAEGRRAFLTDMRGVIEDVADLVETGLADARRLVEDGKAKVQEKLDALGTDLEDFKQDIAEQMNDKFRTLESSIAEKQNQLVEGLARRYVDAFENVKTIEQQVREEFKNFLEKAADAYHAVKDLVVGQIEKLAALVGGAARRIIKDPGTFLSNLGQGIIQGLTMFMGSIGENIKGAVVQWLTGNLGSGGITLPTSFDAKGIIGFLLDLVDLGVAGIKNVARRVFGKRAVALVEKGLAGAEKIKEIFDILAAEGPGGLFRYLTGQFERMKEQVLGQIGKALAEGLVIAGIKKVLGIISGLVSGGVGTVITIVLTIIDVILWFRDNAARLAELVSSIAGAAMAILQGQVSVVANAINGVLKRLLPIVLGFVGALVGIGGVVRKVRQIFKSIGAPARKAITSLFTKFKGLVDKLLAKIGKGKGKKGKQKKLSPAKVRKAIITALEKPSGEEDPLKAIAETKQLAESVRGKYQPQLEKGTIRITVLDKTAEDVEKDGDVAIDVALSPGTKVARKVNVTLVRMFGKQISASHQAARDDIRTSIGKIPKAKSNIRQWETVKKEIHNLTPVSRVIERPVLASHSFGKAMSPLVDTGVRRVDSGATPGQITRVKGQIDSATGDYGTPNQLLKAAVYNSRASTSRIEASIEVAYREETRGKELERPALREGTKRAIRAATKVDSKTGDYIDPNPPRLLIPKNGPFHYGHKRGHEHRQLVKEAQARGMTQGQFNDWVNAHPEWFQIEDPARNLSHEYEMK